MGAEWEETEGLWKVSIRRHGNPADVFVDYAHFFIHGGGLLKYIIPMMDSKELTDFTLQ